MLARDVIVLSLFRMEVLFMVAELRGAPMRSNDTVFLRRKVRSCHDEILSLDFILNGHMRETSAIETAIGS